MTNFGVRSFNFFGGGPLFLPVDVLLQVALVVEGLGAVLAHVAPVPGVKLGVGFQVGPTDHLCKEEKLIQEDRCFSFKEGRPRKI